MKWDSQTTIGCCAIMMGFLALGTMMQTGHGAIDGRITAVESRLNTRLDRMDAGLDNLGERLSSVESNLTDLNQRRYRVESHLFGVEPESAETP